MYINNAYNNEIRSNQKRRVGDVKDLLYLGGELPLGNFSCHQMLRELLILQSTLSRHE